MEVLSKSKESENMGSRCAKRKFNVILVILDALRAKEFYYPDGRKLNTPFLDRLSKSSWVYTKAIAPSTWTLPSCASIFTGLLPLEHGLNFADSKLKSQTLTFAELMSRNGYISVSFSGNPLINYENGLAKGFNLYSFCEPPVEEQLPFKNDVIDVKKLRLPQDKNILGIIRYIFNIAKSEGNLFKNLINLGVYYGKSLGLFRRDKGAAKIKDTAIQWIESWQNSSERRPFCMHIHLMETHEMYLPFISYNVIYSIFNPRKTIKYFKNVRITHFTSRNLIERYCFDEDVVKYLRELYKREIEYLDGQLSSLYKFLQAQGLEKETIFIITSDHGQQLYEHGALGHAMRFYNANLHVPLIIKLPTEDFQIINKFVSLKDLPKTIADYLGFVDKFPGYSFLPDKINQYPQYVISETIADPVFDMMLKKRDIVNELYGLDREIVKKNMYGGISIYYEKNHYILLTNGKIEVYNFENDYNERESLSPEKVKELPRSIREIIEKEFIRLKIANTLRKGFRGLKKV